MTIHQLLTVTTFLTVVYMPLALATCINNRKKI